MWNKPVNAERFLGLLGLLFALNCSNCSNPVHNDPPTGGLRITPTYSGADSLFRLEIADVSDDKDAAEGLQVRIDWEGNGTWDTDWKTARADSHVYHQDGVFNVKVEIKDADGKIGTISAPCSASVWRLKQGRMSVARAYLAAVVINGKIYAVGGRYYDGTFTPSLALLEEYNPVTDVWTRKMDMPTSRDRLMVGVNNNLLYVMGGVFGGVNNEVYDPSLNTWTIKNAMQIARGGATIGAINGKLYMVSGDNTYQRVDEYEPTNDVWTQKTSMNTKRYFSGGGVINDKMYIVGGELMSGWPTNIAEMYDPSTDTWTTKAPMSNARSGLCVCTINGRLYAIGGTHSIVEVYDPVLDQWTTRSSLPRQIENAALGVVNGRIYLFGGIENTSAFSDKIYEYLP
jgi:N-acetylneuraminic acid mutarotase